MNRIITGTLILMFGVITMSAQDSHYWSQQFGTRSALLSGAVVGGIDDNSMIYYNPGVLGFLEEANISVNASLYEIQNVTVENALGAREDFSSSQLGSFPLLISGMLSGADRKLKIGYALLTPVNFSFKGTVRVESFIDLVDENESSGTEEFIADLNIDQRVTETMGALGMSHKINDRVSVGVSHFFIFRNFTYNSNQLIYLFLNNPETTLVSTTVIENSHYFNVRYQLKAGVAWRVNSRWSAGLTVTTPSLNLFGNGTMAANIAAQNISLNGSPRFDLLASDRQEKLKTTYKSPFSVSAGVNYSGNKSKFGISMAYYSGIDPYDIMKAKPATFIRPEGEFGELTSDQFLAIYTGANSVFNMAAGYEYLLNDGLSFALSVRNNMTYYKQIDQPGYNTNLTNWDIWHVMAGANIMKERSTLTVGITPSFGNNDRFVQTGGLGSEDDLLSGATSITRANYFAIGFLLGYTYHFRKF